MSLRLLHLIFSKKKRKKEFFTVLFPFADFLVLSSVVCQMLKLNKLFTGNIKSDECASSYLKIVLNQQGFLQMWLVFISGWCSGGTCWCLVNLKNSLFIWCNRAVMPQCFYCLTRELKVFKWVNGEKQVKSNSLVCWRTFCHTGKHNSFHPISKIPLVCTFADIHIHSSYSSCFALLMCQLSNSN